MVPNPPLLDQILTTTCQAEYYYVVHNIFVGGAVLNMGDEYTSAIFGSNDAQTSMLISKFKFDARLVLDQAKTLLK